MKIFGLLLLCLLSFVVTVVWKFPAAGVLPHVNTNPVSLVGVSGSLWKGRAQQVSSSQSPIALSNVDWRVQPEKLLSGDTGAKLDFEVLGGQGSVEVARSLSGDVSISNGKLQIPAQELEQFLPLPVAEFGGRVIADIESLELENNLLKTTQGTVVWRNAIVTGALEAKLGQIVLDIVPELLEGKQLHRGKLTSKDGELEINGDLQIDPAGNYRADIRLKPLPSASAELTGALGIVGKRASDGSYRIRNNGNIRSLM